MFRLLRKSVTTYLNLEMAATEEMLKIALEAKPDAVTLVAEKPERDNNRRRSGRQGKYFDRSRDRVATATGQNSCQSVYRSGPGSDRSCARNRRATG